MSSVNIRVFFPRHPAIYCALPAEGAQGQPGWHGRGDAAPPHPCAPTSLTAQARGRGREWLRNEGIGPGARKAEPIKLSWLPERRMPRRGFWMMITFFFSCPSQQNKAELHIRVNLEPTKKTKQKQESRLENSPQTHSVQTRQEALTRLEKLLPKTSTPETKPSILKTSKYPKHARIDSRCRTREQLTHGHGRCQAPRGAVEHHQHHGQASLGRDGSCWVPALLWGTGPPRPGPFLSPQLPFCVPFFP